MSDHASSVLPMENSGGALEYLRRLAEETAERAAGMEQAAGRAEGQAAAYREAASRLRAACQVAEQLESGATIPEAMARITGGSAAGVSRVSGSFAAAGMLAGTAASRSRAAGALGTGTTTGGGWLAARMDAGMAELARRVMDLAEERARVPVTGSGGITLSPPRIAGRGEVSGLPAQAPAGEVTVRPDREPAGRRVITSQRLLCILLILVAFWLFQVYTDLSDNDRDLLLAAIAIAGLAWQAGDHIKIRPPDRKD